MPRTFALIAALLTSASVLPSARADGGSGLEFDFLAGARSYDAARFTRIAGDASPSLIAAFEGAPFDDVSVAGVGVDFHIMVNGIRFSTGYARPYVQFSGPIITQDPVTARAATAQVRSMEASEIQFGLGYERDFEVVAGFADLVGTIDTVDTDIAVGETQGTYRSRGFGFSARAGVRRAIHDMFYLHAAGEVGLTGDRNYGVVFGIGFGKP